MILETAPKWPRNESHMLHAYFVPESLNNRGGCGGERGGAGNSVPPSRRGLRLAAKVQTYRNLPEKLREFQAVNGTSPRDNPPCAKKPWLWAGPAELIETGLKRPSTGVRRSFGAEISRLHPGPDPPPWVAARQQTGFWWPPVAWLHRPPPCPITSPFAPVFLMTR